MDPKPIVTELDDLFCVSERISQLVHEGVQNPLDIFLEAFKQHQPSIYEQLKRQIEQIITNEFQKLSDKKDRETIMSFVQKYDHELRYIIYKAEETTNISWIGKYYSGCSFGEWVVICKGVRLLSDMKFKTKKDFAMFGRDHCRRVTIGMNNIIEEPQYDHHIDYTEDRNILDELRSVELQHVQTIMDQNKVDCAFVTLRKQWNFDVDDLLEDAGVPKQLRTPSFATGTFLLFR